MLVICEKIITSQSIPIRFDRFDPNGNGPAIARREIATWILTARLPCDNGERSEEWLRKVSFEPGVEER